jgi:hypothetical protein
MDKIIYNKASGDIVAFAYAAQDIQAVLGNNNNSDYIEIEKLPEDYQFMFTHKVNLTTLEIEIKT